MQILGVGRLWQGKPALLICLQTLGLVFLVAAKIDGSIVARNIDLRK